MANKSKQNKTLEYEKPENTGTGTTNNTDDVRVEAPRTYSKVERAAVQAGELSPDEVVGNSRNEDAIKEEFDSTADVTQSRIEKVR